jgi:tetratricopeptide (TPR) repeat protein
VNLPPSTVSRVHRASGGNPFYAIEIARALQRRGLTRLEGQLRLPDTLAALVRDRLEALSDAAEVVVAHASALSQPTVEVIDAAVASRVSGAGLADAVAAAVVTVDGNLIRFAHPLLAGEAYARLREGERREVHRRLASAVSEPEEHARHLALASAGPDEIVARELDRAAEHAQARGAVESVAELAELAVALTPQDEATRLQRRTRAGHYWMVAGDMGRARAELESALSDSPPGNIRAEVLFRLGEVLQLIGDWPAAERCLTSIVSRMSSWTWSRASASPASNTSPVAT